MTNRETLERAFAEGLGIGRDADFQSLAYQRIPEWDSVAHLQLILELETAFELMLPTEDVLALSSFEKACEILARHGVAVDE